MVCHQLVRHDSYRAERNGFGKVGRYPGWHRRVRRAMLASLGMVLVVVTHFLAQLPAIAQTQVITQARITDILQGNQVYIQNRLAHVRDLARSGEQIRTGVARASLQFNTGAIGRLGNHAALTIGRQCFQLRQGQILVNGAANGCTHSYIAGVRGTTYLLSVDEQGQEQFTVLEGNVALTRRDRPQGVPIVLESGRRVAIDRQGRVGRIQTLTQQEFDSILTSDLVQEFPGQLPGMSAIRDAYEQLYPGAHFPLPLTDAQGWRTQTTLSRTTQAGQPAIALQLQVMDKPETTYANAVYQVYARKDSQWIPVYSNVGARLITNAAGSVTPPAEVIPVTALRLNRLGLNPDTAVLKGVVLLRYDLPNGRRDQQFALETTSTRSVL